VEASLLEPFGSSSFLLCLAGFAQHSLQGGGGALCFHLPRPSCVCCYSLQGGWRKDSYDGGKNGAKAVRAAAGADDHDAMSRDAR